ncbi:MAG: hypothetical protein PHH54_01940 [Candidatus Nanoarchaeia archaeon]|nr:hypothetical protein [Candidatus Nanoarchaeia archaeon]MDD5740723.1 hypothetical protein [Candidatus Nanoarchaeia archaeon]
MTDKSSPIPNKYLELYADSISVIKEQDGRDEIHYYLKMDISGSEKGANVESGMISNAKIPISEALYNQLSKKLSSSKADIFAHLSAKGKLSLTLEERT